MARKKEEINSEKLLMLLSVCSNVYDLDHAIEKFYNFYTKKKNIRIPKKLSVTSNLKDED